MRKSVFALLLLASAALLNAQDTGERVPIRVMTDWYWPTVPDNTWPEWIAIEKRLGIKLTIDFNMGYTAEKVAVTMASGNLPDAILANVLTMPAVYDWVRQGAFQPVEDNLKKYAPELWKFAAPGALQLGSIDGKLYGVPRPRPTSRDMFAIRQDWLNKLNLKVPETVAEFEAALKLFVSKDVDGNGKKDTVGFTPRMPLTTSGVFTAYLGLGNAEEFTFDTKGKVVFNGTRPESKRALEVLRRWYAEGIMDKNIALGPKLYGEESNRVNSAATVGSIQLWLDQIRPSEYNTNPQWWSNPRKVAPDFQWTMIPVLKADKNSSPKWYQNAGTSSHFFVSSKLKDPKKIQKLFEFWNYWASDEGYQMGQWGVEGVDYNIDANGNNVQTDEGRKRVATMAGLRQTHSWEAKMQFAADTPANNKLMADLQTKLDTYAVPNPFIDIQSRSKTYSKLWPDLLRLQDEAYLKIVTGVEPLSSFDKFVKAWNAQGGADLSKELNTIYKAK